MRFSPFRHISGKYRILIMALGWLVVISILHKTLNSEQRSSDIVVMGYMPVITNMAAPLVDFASKESSVHFQAMKFASFAEMGEAFKSGHIQVAFIIAPLAVALRQQGVPLKIVYIGNRHESTLVVRKDLPGKTLSDMVGRTIAVPMRFSGHNLAIKRYMREHGMDVESIRIVEIPPPDMPAALATGGIDGYFVGEPFASKAIYAGTGRKLLDVEEIWPQFICNLVIVREDLIRSHPEWVQMLVNGAARSGLYAKEHPKEAIEVACRYWGQQQEVVSLAFSNPPGRIRFDLYQPAQKEIEEMATEMHSAGLIGDQVDLKGIVEPGFAQSVNLDPPSSLRDIMAR